MSKCLYCYKELDEGHKEFHPSCARKFFGSNEAPLLPYTRDNMSELARKVIRTSASVTGVQAKMSLDVNRGEKNEPSKFTIVGLWGKYIFKPQNSPRYVTLLCVSEEITAFNIKEYAQELVVELGLR